MCKVSDKSELVGKIIGWFDMELPYNKISTLLGIDPKDILIDLEIVYGDTNLSYTTVKEWVKQFCEGRW